MESNHHDVTITGFWDLRVYQFRHVRWGKIDNTNLRAKVQESGKDLLYLFYKHEPVRETKTKIRRRSSVGKMINQTFLLARLFSKAKTKS